MSLLLDTHVFLWWNEGSPLLSRRVRDLLSDPRNRLFLSVVSAWKIVLKVHMPKPRPPSAAAVYIPTRLAHYGIEALPLALDHVLAAESLPAHHRGPFGRMLVAQAQIERLPIVTRDPQMGKYGADTIWQDLLPLLRARNCGGDHFFSLALRPGRLNLLLAQTGHSADQDKRGQGMRQRLPSGHFDKRLQATLA